MPYGKKARSVKAFAYGCLEPIAGANEAIDAMAGRVRLWNHLVELDHLYEPRREAVIAPYISVDNDEEHRQEYREQRRQAFKRDDVKAALKALDELEYEAARQLWLRSGLYWCNYEEVKIAWQQARRRPGKLQFHSFRREVGKVTVRWQNGLPVDEAFGDSTLLRLTPVPDRAYTDPQRCVRRRLSQSQVSIRVASDKRKPVWLTMPCVLHRPLPLGLIRSASVLREKIGTHWRWKLVITVESSIQTSTSPKGKGAVGIDLGWRKRPHGLRACYWHDDSGNEGEIVLENQWLHGMKKVDDLRSIRDTRFNNAIEGLRTWLKQAEDIPEWLQEQTKTLSQWKAPARLALLMLSWRDLRFEGDTGIFEDLEHWRRRDKHLLEYERNLADKLIASRREQYRIFASWLAQTYAVVRIEDFDLRKVSKRKKKGGNADDMVAAARHQRVLAAPSTLRLAILNSCAREGVSVEEVESAYTTAVCSHCGSIERFDKAAELVHDCSACGIRWDQDDNASRNILSQMPALA